MLSPDLQICECGARVAVMLMRMGEVCNVREICLPLAAATSLTSKPPVDYAIYIYIYITYTSSLLFQQFQK